MKTYTVYFEIFGKKMKTTVQANDPNHAEQIIKDRIIFHKIEGKSNFDSRPFDFWVELNKFR